MYKSKYKEQLTLDSLQAPFILYHFSLYNAKFEKKRHQKKLKRKWKDEDGWMYVVWLNCQQLFFNEIHCVVIVWCNMVTRWPIGSIRKCNAKLTVEEWAPHKGILFSVIIQMKLCAFYASHFALHTQLVDYDYELNFIDCKLVSDFFLIHNNNEKDKKKNWSQKMQSQIESNRNYAQFMCSIQLYLMPDVYVLSKS